MKKWVCHALKTLDGRHWCGSVVFLYHGELYGLESTHLPFNMPLITCGGIQFLAFVEKSQPDIMSFADRD